MTVLSKKIALVTGASYGVGKGVAIELAEAGATVYATGRTIRKEAFGAQRVIPIQCDHTNDSEVEAVFRQIADEHGQLDILVNSVWGAYENMVENGEFTWMRPFWKQPLWRWDAMFVAGVRAYYVASACAARMMVQQGRGLIVNEVIDYYA